MSLFAPIRYLFPFVLGGILFVQLSCGKQKPVLREVQASDVHAAVQSQIDSSAVLVNFWATWCEPCVEEFPMIVNLSRRYDPSELSIQFVSVDWLDGKENVVDFLTEQGLSGTYFIKNQDDNEFINGIWEGWTGAVPFNIVYGKETGNVIDFWEGKEPVTRFIRAIDLANMRKNGGAS